MPIQEKKYKKYIKVYADSKGVAIASLSDEEKQQFMIPNPNYRKNRRHGIAAVF